MKILKRNNEFKKMPEKTVEEVLVIRNLINQGWNYCSKELYKEQFKTEKKSKDTESDETPKKVRKSDKKKSK